MLDNKKPPSAQKAQKQAVLRPLTSTNSNPAIIVSTGDMLPLQLKLIPVVQSTIFPGMMVPIILPEGHLINTVESVYEKEGYVGIVLKKGESNASEVATGPSTSISGLPAEGTTLEVGDGKIKGALNFHPYGIVAKIIKKVNLPDSQVSILLSGLERFKIKSIVNEKNHLIAKVEYIYDVFEKDIELEALVRASLSQFKQISKDNPLISEEVKVALVNIDGPGKLADFMASVLIRDVKDYQEFLAEAKVKARLQHLLLLLKKEQEVQIVQKKINDEIHQKVSGSQKEFYLQEQLKFIQKELGNQITEKNKLVDKFRKRLETKTLSKEIKSKLDDDLDRLSYLNENSSEYSVTVNYLDWVTSLPWGVRTKENLNLKNAKKILDTDHYGLKDVKQRILEFLAVKKLKGNSEGSVLCFVGPPGTGKTSLGKSIAKALNRKFFRFSVGGMRDEAEIKGHRRTYVGAMPGKFIQGLKRVESQNPVFLIDEIDKMGTNYSGDPSSALLELLDPEQNSEFLDHYIDLPFDSSEAFFITTANSTDSIPPALLDRMEIISLHGYSDQEKLNISKKHLVPKQLSKNALKASQIKFTDAGLKAIIQQYARESGVRSLEKQISRICRKVAYKYAMGNTTKVVINDLKTLHKYLGQPSFSPETMLDRKIPGIATGLAWTAYGGEVLYIESRNVEGKGGFTLTGSLGEVMQESANIAYTFIRGLKNKDLNLPKNYFDKNLIHLHVPSGATPKDGPSAGVTMAASLYSLVTQKQITDDIAMTGELSLTGIVLPVGGIKEKLLAAKRNGIYKILIPKANEKDLKEIEPEIKKGLKIGKISRMDDVLKQLF